MEKKRILIYGDSNTHGFRVEDGLRYDRDTRWTGVCQNILGDEYEILEEGLNGRTTCHDDYGMEFRNGLTYIEPCIRTHLPLDMVCVMLGSNDLKSCFGQTAESIAANAAKVLEKARWVVESKYPDADCKYVLISPPEIGPEMLIGPFSWDFDGVKTIETSKAFASCFQKVAEEKGFLFFDAAKHAKPGLIDGLHLDEENHEKLGQAIAKWFLKE
ncbi:MAG: acylhydrolase [Firmicutes bacterium]|nr:acylhydrolase [Bacillota bacterium]